MRSPSAPEELHRIGFSPTTRRARAGARVGTTSLQPSGSRRRGQPAARGRRQPDAARAGRSSATPPGTGQRRLRPISWGQVLGTGSRPCGEAQRRTSLDGMWPFRAFLRRATSKNRGQLLDRADPEPLKRGRRHKRSLARSRTARRADSVPHAPLVESRRRCTSACVRGQTQALTTVTRPAACRVCERPAPPSRACPRA
jgi:hypothetical protein